MSEAPLRLALYQPEIPQNCGTLLRLAACLGVPVELIEPFGFLWDDKRLRRAGLDYSVLAEVTRHPSWEAFRAARQERLILLTTSGDQNHLEVSYRHGDILLLGQESAGVPPEVAGSADMRVAIPLCPGTRSLNVAVAGAIVLGEALRQTHSFPSGTHP
ncbi:MAG TPA: tRNA (cytidine(34)-2'-O)-methyltransferase [Kiloniellales bacterium]|nr:tRNA (cytidine(34)-2'-O)-methyltransferase [Kiloniellales bacterium]